MDLKKSSSLEKVMKQEPSSSLEYLLNQIRFEDEEELDKLRQYEKRYLAVCKLEDEKSIKKELKQIMKELKKEKNKTFHIYRKVIKETYNRIFINEAIRYIPTFRLEATEKKEND